MSKRKVRMGMVGGGAGAFIGAVHRIAAALDHEIELVCGAFSSDAARARKFAGEVFLPEERCYGDYREMLQAEAALPVGERMDFVAIVTPNHLHFPVAKAALEAGFHVMSDKPACISLDEAVALRELIEATGLLYGLTHTYTGYPLVKEAADWVRNGKLGEIRKIVVEYPQGWLASPLENEGNKQAGWRMDPARSGPAGAMADIGTHAENLAEVVTGLRLKEVAADLTCFGDGRLLDDDGNVLLRFENGAKGVLHASQICAGDENSLNLRVWGTKGGLEWHQMEPNTLIFKPLAGPAEIHRAGHDYLCDAAQAAGRIPPGHPEGYLEAFANLYRAFAADVREWQAAGNGATKLNRDYPGIEEGVRGMAFIEAVVKSSAANAAWTPLEA